MAVPVPAPTVVTKTKVSLADHLDLRNLPLATTPAGKNFAIKALHPADPEIKAARSPGGCFPSVGLSYDSIETIPFPATAVSAMFIQHPNCMIPACLVFLNSSGNYVDHYLWANNAFGGAGLMHAPANMTAALASFHTSNFYGQVDSYKVLSQSITCDVIAPAVSDQGTIVAAQIFDKPRTIQACSMSSDHTKFTDLVADCWIYERTPDLSALLMGTSAYTSKAREGFYQPLKVDKFKWVSVRDSVWYGKLAETYNNLCVVNTSSGWSNYPIYTNDSPFDVDCKALVKPSANVVGLAYIEGTAGNPSVSLRVRVRQVTEIIPTSGSIYAPLTEAPYPPDELSLKMVREIQARMKDGYPASYNDLGKLKNIISSIGSSVMKYAEPALDALTVVPGIGTAAKIASTGLKVAKALAPKKKPAAAATPAVTSVVTAKKKKKKSKGK